MFNKSKLQTRFILIFSAIIILIVTTVYLFINNYVLIEYKEAVISNANQINVKTSQQIDFYLDNLIQISKNVVTNKGLLNNIKTLDQTPFLTTYDTLYFNRRFESYSSYLMVNTSPSNVYFFGRRNRFNFAYGSLPLKSNFETLKGKTKNISKLFAGKSELIYFNSEPTTDNYMKPSISIIRPISDISTSIYGYTEIQQDYSSLKSITQFENGIKVYILDKNKQIVYPAKKLDEATTQTILKASLSSSKGWKHGSDFYTSFTSEDTGLTTIIMFPNKSIFYSLYKLQNTTLLSILSIGILAIIFFYIITFNLTSPIRKLRKTVINMDYDNFKLFSNFNSTNNELNLLNDAFQTMIERLKQSMNSELNARLSALQGQISPHFIHNVLYLIIISAEENKKEEVIDLCQNLSNMLRYMADSPFRKVTLEEEVKYAQNYLYLMQSKYEDFITYNISISDQAKSVLLPRLTLQPFIENSINHAFNDCLPPWNINITCNIIGDKWNIIIEDNGSGISQDELTKLQNQIKEILDDPSHQLASLKGIGGMGILNTVTRLKLTFPESLQVKMVNNQTAGLSIYIQGDLT